MKDDPIYFWVSDGCAWIRVTGDACFLNSTRVSEFGKKMVHRGIRQFAVDLEECSGLDSTFMGTLAGIALRLRELGKGTLRVLNVQPEHEKQFRDLGLDELFFD